MVVKEASVSIILAVCTVVRENFNFYEVELDLIWYHIAPIQFPKTNVSTNLHNKLCVRI